MTENVIIGEIWLEQGFGHSGWYIYSPKRQILWVIGGQGEDLEKVEEWVKNDLKANGVNLPEKYHFEICHSVVNVNYGENLDDEL